MDPDAGTTAAKVAEILRANPDGISRAGLLAWARLRISSDLDDERLDAALAELGSAVSVEDGFVQLVGARDAATASEPGIAASGGSTPRWPTAPVVEAGANADTGPAADRIPADKAGSSAPAMASGAGPISTASLVAQTEIPPSAWIPGSRPSRGFRGLIAAGAVIAIVAFAILGRNASDGSSAGSSAIPSDPRGSIAAAADLTTGTCFVIPTASQFSEVEVRPCDAPHDGEIVGTWDHEAPTAATYPPEADWQSLADAKCQAAFDSYTGQTYADQATLGVGYFTPTEEGWKAGDRMVQCYLQRTDGGVISRSYRAGS